MAGWYELSRSSDGQYWFVLKAGNGERILTSELYKAKQSALDGIASCQANSTIDARYSRQTATSGQPYFNLKASNGQTIGTSQMYNSMQARESGIESVKTNGPSKTVKDLT